MSAQGAGIRRITYHSASDILADWSPDGTKLLFSSSGRGPSSTTPYEVDVETGHVREVLEDVCSISVTGYSPDGKKITGIRRGTSWWRKGHRGAGNSQLMVHDTESDTMDVVTTFPGMDNWPVFSADGESVYFISERNGRPNVFSMKLDGQEKPEALTSFEKDAATFLSASADREWLIFEWNFDLWMVRSTGGKPRTLELRAPIDYRKAFVTTQTVADGIQEMEVNRDGKLVAIRLKDDIFFVKPEFKNDSIRVTDWAGPDGDYFWSLDGKELAYISQVNGTADIWVVNGETLEKRCLVRDDKFYLDMLGYSREGTKVLFRKDAGGAGIFAADAKTGEVTKFLPDPNIEDLAVSPDGRWILAQIAHQRSGTDLYIKPVEGGEWINVTKHPDGNWGCHWTPDGKKIIFISRRDGNSEIYSIDLQRQPDKFEDYEEQEAEKRKQEDEKKKPPEPPKPPAEPPKAEEETEPAEGGDKPDDGDKPKDDGEKKPDEEKPDDTDWKPKTIDPFEIDFQRIESRAKRLTNTSESEGTIMFLDGGKTVAYTKDKEIWAMEPDGKKQRRLVNGSFSLGSVRLQGDGKQIVFVDGGKLKRVAPRGGNPTDVDWKAKIKRDEREVQKEAFRQGWAALDERFYDQHLHGVDWDAEYARYAAHCDGTLTADEFNHLAGRLIGELNASHLGAYGGPGAPSGPSTATLGITPDGSHVDPGVLVADVMPESPADKPGSTIAVGEYILTIDGEEVSNTERYYELLTGREGERVKLQVGKEPKLEGAREVSIKPISGSAYGRLRYERWVRDNRARAKRMSNGRVFYAHIEGMNSSSLTRFKREIYGEAQNYDALLIDVRNNGGGSTHDQVLEILTKEVHGWTARRGAPLRASPSSQFDGPKALLINQYSGSDAEIFPNAFREKGLGPLIGMPTSGAVIGTQDITLVNGHRFRVPLAGWFTKDGANLENMGVKPDVEVPYPYEAYRDGKDPQVRRAVEVLMNRLEEAGPARPPDVPH